MLLLKKEWKILISIVISNIENVNNQKMLFNINTNSSKILNQQQIEQEIALFPESNVLIYPWYAISAGLRLPTHANVCVPINTDI